MPRFDPADVEECRRIAEVWAPTLRALANPERLLIVLWLAGGTRSVRELEQATGMRQSLVSYHLRELREAGLVTSSVEGRSNRYRLCGSDLDEVAALIGSVKVAAQQKRFASLMIAAGVNARALSSYMGHASVTITYDRYGHLMPGNEEEAAALLDAYLERSDTRGRLAALDG